MVTLISTKDFLKDNEIAISTENELFSPTHESLDRIMEGSALIYEFYTFNPKTEELTEVYRDGEGNHYLVSYVPGSIINYGLGGKIHMLTSLLINPKVSVYVESAHCFIDISMKNLIKEFHGKNVFNEVVDKIRKITEKREEFIKFLYM